MTGLVQASMFLSSYSPLLAVFALLDTFGRGVPSFVCGCLAVIGVGLLPILFLRDRRTSPQQLEVAAATPRDSDVLAYIASYLVPFATVEADTVRLRVAVSVFIALIAVLYVRSHLFYTNPLLALIGYRVFQVDSEAGTPSILLSRRRFIAPKTRVAAVRLSDYVWREKAR